MGLPKCEYQATNRLIKTEKGLTVVELVIALALLGMVLGLGYMFYAFGTTTFAAGETQSNVQQSVRIAANMISNEVRYAETAEILDSLAEDTFPDDDYTYIYGDGHALLLHQQGEVTPIRFFGGMADDGDVIITFKPSSTNSKLLDFKIVGTNKKGTPQEKEYIIDYEVLLPNISSITINTDDNSGSIIRYSTPKPPEPTVQNISIVEDDTNPLIANITIYTKYLLGTVDVTATIWQPVDGDFIKIKDISGLKIYNNEANFSIDFVDYGSYRIEFTILGIENPPSLNYVIIEEEIP
ncbi:MAG: hypothetical protein NUK65_02860 [Firmicutes bacterium]|nr:hypothetical protein [Bacillota bacterium]